MKQKHVLSLKIGPVYWWFVIPLTTVIWLALAAFLASAASAIAPRTVDQVMLDQSLGSVPPALQTGALGRPDIAPVNITFMPITSTVYTGQIFTVKVQV